MRRTIVLGVGRHGRMFGLLCLGLLTASPGVVLAVPAFPGATGGGAVSVGGRGGAVIMVTNLNSSGPGSLLACLQASGPRTCVFRVGGRINMTTGGLYFSNPYVTIAGQTAPGEGVMITGPGINAHLVAIDAHDVIWRYTRVAHGYNQAAHDQFIAAGDANAANFTMFSGAYNVIVDHNSSWWNQDEGLSWGGGGTAPANRNITYSYNIQAEGIDGHQTGALISGANDGTTVGIDLHHNLMMNNNHRAPLVRTTDFRMVNNIVYNFRLRFVQIGGVGAKSMDFIGNIFRLGPLNFSGNSSYPNEHEFLVSSTGASIYLSRNRGFSQSNPDGNQWVMVYNSAGSENGPEGSPTSTSQQRLTPLANTLAYPIASEPVESLEANLLPDVGHSRALNCDGTWRSVRNSVDARLINQYNTNTGNSFLLARETDVGGFPSMSGGTPCADADLDGMPDVWETAHGLNPNNAADRNGDLDADGFTNLEEYLNGNSAVPGDLLAPMAPTKLIVV